MKKLIIILASLAGLFCSINIYAQTSSGTTYYRIMSAKHTFSTCCIQDNSSNSNGGNDFLISVVDSSNLHQQWMLIPNQDSTAFYIRNCYSNRYIGQSYVITNNFYYTQDAAIESTAAQWRITPIKEDQVAFSSIDEFGVTRFLNAADLTADTPDKISYISTSGYSGFAWILVKINTGTTGLNNVSLNKDINVSVLGRQIIVNGTNDYRIYDISGRAMQNGQILPHGIYIVSTHGQSFKVFVK
ncbi:MAG: hypothetical protein PHU66_06705 [Bacteroidaceae bacterium]|jgi:hypothetical protein|nr:hypothetical protein [Bacteroidaceae bacterium]